MRPEARTKLPEALEWLFPTVRCIAALVSVIKCQASYKNFTVENVDYMGLIKNSSTMMKATGLCETSVRFQQPSQRYIPKVARCFPYVHNSEHPTDC
jgi:hypothetical protein